MERRTGEPSTLPTHRTFKTSNTVHFHSSRTGELRKKHSCAHTQSRTQIYTLFHTYSTFTRAHAGGKDSLSEFMD